MEIGSAFNMAEVQPDLIQQEVKPLKGFNFESNVQQFEQVLFDQQHYVFKGVDSLENLDTPSAVSKLGEAFFEKAGDFKKSTDQRMQRVSEMISSPEEWGIKDVLVLQWEVAMYTIESNLLTASASKADEGIKTLFRNQ